MKRMFYTRLGPTRTPCLSRWMSGRCPYARNRARASRVEAGATSPAKAADSTPYEPHDGQVYLNPRSWDDRIRSAAAPHNGQFAGSGSMAQKCCDMTGAALMAQLRSPSEQQRAFSCAISGRSKSPASRTRKHNPSA